METGEGFDKYLAEQMAIINSKLEEYLSNKASDQFIEKILGRAIYEYDKEAINKAVLEPSWYLLNSGGKRWRPVLMLLIIEALGKKREEYIEFSIIPEIIHNATLVHDDIEDRSETRRGKPSVHIKFGEDIAVNLGDFLYYFPIVALLDSKKLTLESKNRILSVYTREMLRVATGQATDIAWHNFLVPLESINEEKYLQMVYNKTGVLARMACKMGAILGGANDEEVEKLGHFGATIGVAFQLQDDLLNITPSTLAEKKGGLGDDITEGKITLMVIDTMQRASQEDKKRLLDILKMHTTDQNIINEAISIIDKYGSKKYAKKRSIEIVKEAWSGIESLLPDSEAKSRIKDLTEFLISRSL
ncbi:MAG: polyprenyl synthetase family protein [Candidatus Micrarchaeaceae archaeon]